MSRAYGLATARVSLQTHPVPADGRSKVTLVKLRDLEGADRRIATVTAAIAVVLVVGLIVTGVWLFLFHDPDWDTYVVGVERQLVSDPTGMADLHQTLGDLSALLVLWTTAWLSYRVFAKVSMTGLVVLAIVFSGVLTGKIIRVNAVIRDGIVDVNASGYADVLRGNYDFLIVGESDLEPLAAVLWTLAHLFSLPAALVLICVMYYRSRIKIRNAPEPEPTWLDHLA